jgi:hypothetical protein
MDHRDQEDYEAATAQMIGEMIAEHSGAANPALTTVMHNLLERAVLAAMADERKRCLEIVENTQPIIRPGEQHPDTKATLRAVATLIRARGARHAGT